MADLPSRDQLPHGEPRPPAPSQTGLVSYQPGKRSLAALVTAVVGLITSVAALKRPSSEPGARGSYEVLSLAIENVSREIQENRTDVANLRKSFEEYVAAKEGPSSVQQEPVRVAGEAVPPVKVVVKPTPPVASGKTAKALPPAKEIVLPPVKASASAPPRLPSFDQVKAQAESKDSVLGK